MLSGSVTITLDATQVLLAAIAMLAAPVMVFAQGYANHRRLRSMQSKVDDVHDATVNPDEDSP